MGQRVVDVAVQTGVRGMADARGTPRSIGAAAEAPMSESATMMSADEHTGKAPSARSAFVPSEVALRMDPARRRRGPSVHRGIDGVARTTVVPALDDDDDVAQRGQEAVANRKAPLLGRTPAGDSDTMTPDEATRSQSRSCRLGYGWSSPPATTPTGGAPAPHAPSWAAPSIPSARPETTLTPAAERSAPNWAATPMP